MKAITTKYLGPTDTKGSRIVASDEDGNRIILSRKGNGSIEENHRWAAEALCKKMSWEGRLVCGSIKNGYVFVFVK